MSRQTVKWTAALAASIALHSGAAIWLGTRDEPVAIAGGAKAEIAVLGNAFQDTVAAGAQTEAVEPLETEDERLQPVEADTASEAAAKAAKSPSKQVSEPLRDVATAEPARPSHSEGAAPDASASSAEADPVEPNTDGIAIAALQPRKAETPEPTAQPPHDSEPVEPVEVMDIPATPDVAPRPTARPEQIARVNGPKQTQKARETRKKQEKATAKPRQRSGSAGQSAQNRRSGSADGTKQAKKTASGNTGRSRESGNASVSNYPGKVYAKLRRSLRYPSEARRKRIRGEVHVRFTVSRSGGVGSIRVARSSGSALLDGAALETVRRAAPFPEIPAAAGRSSWSFTVPLSFTR